MSPAVVYLDSSALLKLVFEEHESEALAAFLDKWPARVCSMLARVELLRIVARVEDPLPLRDAQRVLRNMNLARIDDAVIMSAAMLEPRGLRSLDAIHLATARGLGHHLAGMVTYDHRLADAARHHDITVWSPAPT